MPFRIGITHCKQGGTGASDRFCPPIQGERKKALTTIQQNNFTPQPPPASDPITLTVCVTPRPSTTSRQHYLHRTVPLYMERRIYFLSLFEIGRASRRERV